ncbi:unnamed protein product [Lactuca saligna]|uniref:Wall-associated receptor kinase galacturonan-binding domain-containing protein n=1 Tax=Lactuca saligna TaxID=75948 RepID=A0AA35VK44_LACSI|nr:unnamed protein product [Lactuca saligna]
MQVFRVLHLFILISLTTTTTLTKAKRISKKGCNDTCGGILIPFPFGIGSNCFLNKWYNVDCNSSIPYLSALNNVELLSANSFGDVTVNISMTFDCENSMQNSTLVLSDESPFSVSDYENNLLVKGCGIYADVKENGSIVAGCSMICPSDTGGDRNNCFGIGCCQDTIPYYIKSFSLNRTGLERPAGDGSCGSAFFMGRGYFPSAGFPRQSVDGHSIYVPITLSWYPTYRDISSNWPECRRCKIKGGYCSINVDAASGVSCYIYGRSKIGVILGKHFLITTMFFVGLLLSFLLFLIFYNL